MFVLINKWRSWVQSALLGIYFNMQCRLTCLVEYKPVKHEVSLVGYLSGRRVTTYWPSQWATQSVKVFVSAEWVQQFLSWFISGQSSCSSPTKELHGFAVQWNTLQSKWDLSVTMYLGAEKTNFRGRITVQLTSCLFCLN